VTTPPQEGAFSRIVGAGDCLLVGQRRIRAAAGASQKVSADGVQVKISLSRSSRTGPSSAA